MSSYQAGLDAYERGDYDTPSKNFSRWQNKDIRKLNLT